jgi:hypothetical protein
MAITRYATKVAAEATGGQVSWVFDDEWVRRVLVQFEAKTRDRGTVCSVCAR